MRNRTKLALAGLTASLTMALALSSATAGRLSYSNQGFRIVWASLTFSESGGNFPISCPVTLEGSFHSSTLRKVLGALVSYITRAIVNDPACSEGHATILRESLPWHVLYEGFTGTLPTISSVRHYLIGAAFQVEPSLGVVCLARSSIERPAAGDATRNTITGQITTLEPDSLMSIPVIGGAACPRAGIFAGSGEVFALGSSTTRIRLNLI
jgi:hypothetical protein